MRPKKICVSSTKHYNHLDSVLPETNLKNILVFATLFDPLKVGEVMIIVLRELPQF